LGRRFDDKVTRKRHRRGFVWVLGAVALVTGLLYWEQAAIIYVLSVLALCGFLLVVAFSDLDRGARQGD
jgi:preprotein translocase subunit SecE